MKETCCDFCGREKNEDELVKFGKARICLVCREEQKNNNSHGKVSRGDVFKNSKLAQ